MNYKTFSLNGMWKINYQKELYDDTVVPKFDGISVKDVVPGFWEDMEWDAEIHPEYEDLHYPIKDTAPDMTLKNYVGNFFYKKEFALEKEINNAKIYFEGVQNTVLVWINDKFIGKHSGYSTPFNMDIPDGTLKKGQNTVVMSVSNFTLSGFDNQPVLGLTTRAVNRYTGGISGKVEIRQYLCPLYDLNLTVSADTKTASVSYNEKIQVEWAVYDGKKKVKLGTANGDFSFETDGLLLWSPENPKQYVLEIKCERGSIKRKFGVRRLTAEGHKLFLNGKPYYLRGVCEHCYYPKTVHPVHHKKEYIKMIKSFKKLGFNFIRFHTYVPYIEYLEAADELGMLVQVECPNNTNIENWEEIVNFAKGHPSVVIFCCGNELLMDEPFIEHLKKCADIVHKKTDCLFSPLSALRGLEYYLIEPEIMDDLEEQPFQHYPVRFETVGEFADLYNSYALGLLSYHSQKGDSEVLDSWQKVYNKPRLSHEICIDGTYTDLSVEKKYKGTRIGQTDMFGSIKRHLEEKGLLKNAPLYFKNSCKWQSMSRKYCFETTRRCNTIYGFDFLGPIDTHWHTFGYDVGMMNEFYKLKPGETVKNVLTYNSPTVVLTDIMKNTNYYSGDTLNCNFYVSNFSDDYEQGELKITVSHKGRAIYKEKVNVKDAVFGEVTKVHGFSYKMPYTDKYMELKLTADYNGQKNSWDIYLFPENNCDVGDLVITNNKEEMINALNDGKNVAVIGETPFETLPTLCRIGLAGRTSGNLATVINSHPITKGIKDKYCNWQFNKMLEGGNAVCFNTDKVPFNPIIEVVSTHKYIIKQSALFELNVGKGKLIVCSFNFDETDPCANWFKNKIIAYANSNKFNPKDSITVKELDAFLNQNTEKAEGNTNFAFNQNDATARRK